MELVKTFMGLCAQMRGAKVVHKRMFLRTLQLYLLHDESSDSESAMEIWCEPPWQLTNAVGLLADSQTIPTDGDGETYDRAQRLVSLAAGVLLNHTIEDLYLDRETQSLCVELSGGLEIHTFPLEDSEHEQWTLRGPGGEPSIAGCEEGIYLAEDDSQV